MDSDQRLRTVLDAMDSGNAARAMEVEPLLFEIVSESETARRILARADETNTVSVKAIAVGERMAQLGLLQRVNIFGDYLVTDLAHRAMAQI